MKGYIPKGQPASRAVAVLLSIGSCGLAIAAARELWTKRTGTELKSWLKPVFDLIARAKYEPWMLPLGVAVVILGIYLVAVALKPRPMTHVQLAASPNFWVRNVDIARLCTATAERVPSVAGASTYASPKHVIVSITGSDQHHDLAQRVEAAILPIVEQLESPRKISVKFHNKFGGE
ncbi:hypothetical protein CKALI_10220 [Corynebacterium kalinowskii]|uniref:DUF6286 domain-containing protein n=1 Tax=Corynebacterium kalinowskii TaxID=2675216 RepID=A0A6B8VIQ4_9CORY|nr:DUF6286 domain-containing protein [Corynebacterium kalinowskii]QGU02899.1 hypothetical protein CKALI_10220 [Corynebacterium kalinowskii]